MLKLRRAAERGHLNHGWLDTFHTFSFADYHDPEHISFRSLRVMNEDTIAPGMGFGMHGHRDMEIITYVLSGALEHKDSLGNGEILRAGEFQRMSAGTGVRHSEFNPSSSEPVHLYQIWLLPRAKGVPPSYEQRRFDTSGQLGKLRLVASPDGSDDSLTIQQDARVYVSQLVAGRQIVHPLESGRHAWLQVLRGSLDANGQSLQAGDGLGISDESQLTIVATADTEIMLFDLS
ncbi:MAG: pirin family protein [Planctomycetaceae bacterium]|nr:pirin family protein [Planctomycetaceae bacterium]